VLAQMAARLGTVVERSGSVPADPARRLEDLFLRLFDNLFEFPEDMQLVMRELLDNRPRAERAHSWPLKDFLEALAARVRAAPNTAALDETEAMARVYFVLGAMNYFAVSQPTLTQMFGKAAFKALREQLRAEIRRALQTA
jgi:hypothetical protein